MTVPAAATRLTAVSATADSRGLAAASTAFVIWGVLPLYLKQLQHVPALQITAHRLVWGCLFGMLLLGVPRRAGVPKKISRCTLILSVEQFGVAIAERKTGRKDL